MTVLRIAAALVDDLTGLATGAIWRLALLAVLLLPIWVFYV
jgi:hypothetical protein